VGARAIADSNSIEYEVGVPEKERREMGDKFDTGFCSAEVNGIYQKQTGAGISAPVSSEQNIKMVIGVTGDRRKANLADPNLAKWNWLAPELESTRREPAWCPMNQQWWLLPGGTQAESVEGE
jgi:hypothetical protein